MKPFAHESSITTERHAGLLWRRAGPRLGPSVVLLHPIATDGTVWERQIEALAGRYDVIAIDLPGHGGSDLLEATTMADHAAAVAASILAGGISRCAVIGLSLGSMVAQSLAADHGAVVSALVLANGVAVADAATRAAWHDRIATARACGMPALRDAMLARWFSPEYTRDQRHEVRRIGAMIDAAPAAGFIHAAAAIATLDNRDALARITCPTLVVAGSRDAAAPVAAVTPIADAIAGACRIVLDAPHLANVETADAFSAHVGAFLDSALDRAA